MNSSENRFNLRDFGITNDDELKKICYDLNIKLNYIGYEHNLIFRKKESNGAYILNIGDNFGTHWTCFYIEDKKCFYFDSYKTPPNNEVILFCNKNKIDNLYYNNLVQFQANDEQYCGIWCIVFLYYFQKNKTIDLNSRFNEFIKLFN